MTMAAVLRACAQLNHSSKHPTAQLGPQMVGFLFLLAISGSTVALLSFAGKSKLLSTRQQEVYSYAHKGEEEEEEGGGEGDDEVTHLQEVYPYAHKGEEDNGEEEEEGGGGGEGDDEVTHLQECSCHYSQNGGIVPPPFRPKRSTTPTPSKPKRVTFSPDVIDPPSNGQLFRSKRRVSLLSHRPQETYSLPTPTSSLEPCPQLRHLLTPTPLTPKAPSIPPNRLALYRGLLHSKRHSLYYM
ncbi:hypothetical protein L7F22_004089 [Adiantum nelumboides]|nr:hypothetical protein [Adiantum nelumboides]